ncbi:unnamed protein product, partial [marine sediment metagenome]
KEMEDLKEKNETLNQEIDCIRMELLEIKIKQVQALQKRE